jgi:hypothetical protein
MPIEIIRARSRRLTLDGIAKGVAAARGDRTV